MTRRQGQPPPPRRSSRSGGVYNHHHFRPGNDDYGDQVSSKVGIRCETDLPRMDPRPAVCHDTETQPARNLAEADRQPRTPPGLGIMSRFYKADVHPPVPLFALPPTPDELSPDSTTLPPLPSPSHERPILHRRPTLDRNRSSTWRPTSSVYSHNPLVTSDFANLATYGYYGAGGEGISPPSSPEMAAVQQGRDVSPIDEFPDKSGFDQRPSRQPSTSQSKSNIPMMRRQRRQTQEAAAATLRESKSRDRLRDRPVPTGLSSDAVAAYPSPGKGEGAGQSATGRQVFKMANGREMKWDAMTGEPTLGPKGYSAQVKPAEYAQEFGTGGHGAGASAAGAGAGAGAGAAPASNPAASALSRLRSAQSSFSDKVKKMRAGDAAAGPSIATAPERLHTLSPEPEEPPPVQRSTTPSAQLSATARPPRAASLAQRPQWKGGSGRVTLVDPVHDTPQDPPVHIPRKSSKRTANLSRGARGGPGGPLSLSPVSPSGSETSLSRVGDPTTTTTTTTATTPRKQQHMPSPLASPDPSNSTHPLGKDYPSPPNSGSAIPPSYAMGPLSPSQPNASPSMANATTSSSPPPPRLPLTTTTATATTTDPAPAPFASSFSLSTSASPLSLSADPEKAIRRKPATSTAGLSTSFAPRASASASANAEPSSKPPQAHHNPHLSTASSVYSQFDAPPPVNYSNVSTNVSNVTVTRHTPATTTTTTTAAVPTATGAGTTTEDGWVQPPSRFSVTTYATSAHTGSPKPSMDVDRPPMPTPPQAYSSLLSNSPPGRKDNLVITMNQPYMSGARGGSSPIGKPMGPRDAVPSYLRSNTWGDSSSSVFSADARPGSVASTSKALPPAPPEINPANDRVGYLNARLQSLANRRININKSIKKMTEMMPTDNLMASDAVLRKREAEKVKIESLKVELSEVQREEYELGLKLHRAYKRQDRDAEYEPTTLWVRRVTGA